MSSKMIALSDGCWVAADHIAEVKVNSESQTITVRMKDGIGHVHQPGYGTSLYRAADKLILEIDKATSLGGGV